MANAEWLELANSLPRGLSLGAIPGEPGLRIAGIALDSRKVQADEVFVALTGGSSDGHRFINHAVERGAVAVVGQQPNPGLAVPYLQVSDSRKALAHLAAAFYGRPARKLTVAGVTGTDGKTTTATLLFSMLQAAGLRAGLVSTVSARIGEAELDTGFHVTTPEAPEMQAYLRRMVDAELTHAVLEVTSHGLAQQRVEACEFDLALVTNITHEHLDYHGSTEAYRAAKSRLFTMLAETEPKPQGNPRLAALNRDDDSYGYLLAAIRAQASDFSGRAVRVVSYGLHPQADVRAVDVRHTPGGLRFMAQGEGWRVEVESPLAGLFNVANVLAALTAAVEGAGVDPEAAGRGAAGMTGIPGRMQAIALGQEFSAIVDFAHTPNALRRALETGRGLLGPGRRLIAVFGSAGLRDREKRRLMAEAAVELADLSILTAEDPRTESLEAILEEMASGAQARGGVEGKTFWRMADRREALRLAVKMARQGDLVIALGKGHEQSMCFGEIEYAWDDRTALAAAISEHLGIPGPEMPYLPVSG